MKTEFTPGTRVRFDIPDGCLARISNTLRSSDWQFPGYLGNGFYEVITIPEGRRLIVKEDEIILAPE